MQGPPLLSVSWKQHELASSLWNLKPTSRGFCPLRPYKGTTYVRHGPLQFDSPLQTSASRSLASASFVDTRVLCTDPQSSKSPLPRQCVCAHPTNHPTIYTVQHPTPMRGVGGHNAGIARPGMSCNHVGLGWFLEPNFPLLRRPMSTDTLLRDLAANNLVVAS